MPRVARRKSESGIYHVVLRGINRQTIFADDEDNEKFMHVLSDCKKISGYKLFAFCLMGNHVHLLIKEVGESLEKIFKRIGVRYVSWYNRKYERSGHLFQDRFRSEPVDNDGYFLTVLRYIHQNPQKAGLCKSIDKHKWSSYREYLGKKGITDIDFALTIIRREEFIEYMSLENQDKSLESEVLKKRLTDAELTKIIIESYSVKPIMVQNEPKERAGKLLREIMNLEGVSARQLSRITGISANVLWKL